MKTGLKIYSIEQVSVSARSSHQVSTAANDASYPDVFSHLLVLNVLQSTHPRPKVRKPAWPRRLVALATKPGEKRELVPLALLRSQKQVETGIDNAAALAEDLFTGLAHRPTSHR